MKSLLDLLRAERERCAKVCEEERQNRLEREKNPLPGDDARLTIAQAHKAVTAAGLAAAIRALPDEAVPPGKLLAREPTEEMLNAAAVNTNPHPTRPDRWHGNWRKLWYRMYDAAEPNSGTAGDGPPAEDGKARLWRPTYSLAQRRRRVRPEDDKA